MPRQIPDGELDRIVTIVAQRHDGVGADAIREGLGVELSERTLQRRLHRLASEGRISAVGSGRGKRYFPASVSPRAMTEPRDRGTAYGGSSETGGPSRTQQKYGASTARRDSRSGRKRIVPRPARPKVALSLLAGPVPMKQALVRLMRERDWQVLDLQFYAGSLPPGPPPDGVFVTRVWPAPEVQSLHDQGCCLVRLGRLVSPWDHLLPAVVEDHQAAGLLAAEHFAERRFRHVGIVGYGEMRDMAWMYEPFRRRAEALGCECHQMVFEKLTRLENDLPASKKRTLRIDQLAQWFMDVPKPIGMLAWTDNAGGRISVAVQEAGLDIPSQVAVLGHGNDIVRCESTPVPLSSIDSGISQQAEAAVELMARRFAGEPLPKTAVLIPPVGLVVRQSTDILAVTDPVVARALRFMWDHLEQDLGTSDVAEATGVSRRNLERMFRKHLGSSIRSELRRRRLEQLQILLRTTDTPIADLAPLVGFQSAQYLSNQFRREVGMSPRQYRKLNGPGK